MINVRRYQVARQFFKIMRIVKGGGFFDELPSLPTVRVFTFSTPHLVTSVHFGYVNLAHWTRFTRRSYRRHTLQNARVANMHIVFALVAKLTCRH